MATVLLATDADWIHEDVDAALAADDVEVHRVRAGRDVRDAAAQLRPDLVVLDLQIGNMGGVAAALDLRQEHATGRQDDCPILLLLDRDADVFLAEIATVDDHLIKPLNAFDLRRVATKLLTDADPASDSI